MQQTKKFKLNLIEKKDAFSPDPLNDNMEKLAAELSRLDAADAVEAAARAADKAAMESRVKTLELHQVVIGQKSGYGGVTLGFRPKVVFVSGSNRFAMLTDTENGYISSNGFTVHESYANCTYAAFA